MHDRHSGALEEAGRELLMLFVFLRRAPTSHLPDLNRFSGRAEAASAATFLKITVVLQCSVLSAAYIVVKVNSLRSAHAYF